MTKLRQFTTQNQIPAGIFSGIEAFWHNGEKWVIANGTVFRYNEAPTLVKSSIQRAFLADKQSRAYLSKIGITSASETFDRWYRCVVGGLDHTPDFLNNKLTADAYNNMCADHSCIHRGRLCSRATGLKNYEVETLSALKQGESLERTAAVCCVSLPGMKSRVEKIKEKWNVTNMAALMATATQLGI